MLHINEVMVVNFGQSLGLNDNLGHGGEGSLRISQVGGTTMWPGGQPTGRQIISNVPELPCLHGIVTDTPEASQKALKNWAKCVPK
jgi:hypothetical protein